MSNGRRTVLGLMSGTSMDGIDVAAVAVECGDPGRFELLAAETFPLPDAMKRRLGACLAADTAELARLDMEVGRLFAEAAATLAGRLDRTVDLVGSHGQTVYHEHAVTTLQIGEPALIADRLGCPVVADFRRNDVAVGGCGAPLVPIVDRWLLSRDGAPVVALNIGGIANLTWLPPRERTEAPLAAFDCGPGNMILDELARRFTGGRLQADLDGAFAARGRVRDEVVAHIMDVPTLGIRPRRSLGREQFGAAFVDGLLAAYPPDDEAGWYVLFASAVEATCLAISGAVAEMQGEGSVPAELVVGGGGARNPALMRRLGEHLAPVPVTVADARGLSADFKEAIAFALLASARIDRIPANVPEVTGASRPVLLGKLVEL
ncbi:MAG: anhydro-N-acetylmuramic acid kinase [Geminicoccaceae bacterium]